MAGVEPYAPCPCGSGQKFKWCCQKVESFADRAQRLFDTGQVEAAIKVLDEGLRKEPSNPWLLTRKAIMQIRHGEPGPAKVTLRQVLAANPKHFGALVLLTRCVLETEGPVNGAGMFQQVLAAVEQGQRPSLAGLARVVAYLMAETHLYPAALKHLELTLKLGEDDGSVASAARSLEATPAVAPWLKDSYRLAPPPSHLHGETRGKFERAMNLASIGLWAPAAAGFDALTIGDPGGPADFNLGLCRLWLGDEAGAVGPLRRRSRALGDSPEAVDIEALCQLIEPISGPDRVEQVQLIWPVLDRDALLAALRAAPDVFDEGPSPSDPEDPSAPGVEGFALLDRPVIDRHDGRGLSVDQVPKILGRIALADDFAGLVTYDDGRVDSLGDRFTALAGRSIDGASTRTEALGVESRAGLAMTWDWLYPAGLDPLEADRLEAEKRSAMFLEVWPETPMPYLGHRTPSRAARDGNAAIPLRAALCQLEQINPPGRGGVDFAALRERLGVPPEPPIDPETVDVATLPLARLARVPVDRLADEALVAFYRRARRAMIAEALKAAALAIVARPSLFERGLIDGVSVHSDLASMAAGLGRKDEALEWLAKGRQAESPANRVRNAPVWDMLEVRLRARLEAPETWVPDLAVILERYAQDPTANQVILMNLVELGLIQVKPNPDHPDDVLLDSRPLQAVLAEFGPRITTASGRLGVSATKPEVWTPGGPASSAGGGLWTPGSASPSPAANQPSKLILPGR